MPERKLKPRRSYVPGAVPLASELEANECVVNWNDGVLFVKTTEGHVLSHPIGTSSFTLPVASDSVLGGIKVGSGLTISSGVLSATGGGSGGGSSSLVVADTPAGFPSTGSPDNLYCASDSQRVYRWDSANAVYVEVGPL